MSDSHSTVTLGSSSPTITPVTPPVVSPPASVVPPSPPAGGDGGAPQGASPATPSPSASPTSAEGEGASPTAATPPAKPNSDWRDQRIARLSAQLKEEKAKAAAAPAAPTPPVTGPAPGSAEFDQAVQIEARRRVEIEAFNNSCNSALASGRETFGQKEFDGRVAGLLQLVDLFDRDSVAMYQSFLTAAIKAGQTEKLIFELGGDLNEAQRIMGLGPVDMAVEMTKRAAKIDQAAAVAATPAAPALPSNAPAPPSTLVGGRGAATATIDPADPTKAMQLPSQEWHIRRAEQVAERQKRAASGR